MSYDTVDHLLAHDDSSSGDINRMGAYAALAGASLMILGAVLWIASGTDLDGSLADGTMSIYLDGAAEQRLLIVSNIALWILGVLVLGVAGTVLTCLCTQRRMIARIGMLCYWTAVPLAITAFVAWMALVEQLAPAGAEDSMALAETIGWFASRADWIATVLIVGIGPAIISWAGRDDWVPAWLARWGAAAGAAGILTVAALFMNGLTTYGFLVVPVGLGWTVAAGVVLVRRGRPASQAKVGT